MIHGVLQHAWLVGGDGVWLRGCQRLVASDWIMLSCRMCEKVCADARMCGMCKERGTPLPAYYCSKDCAKQHWTTEHKAWHAAEKTNLDYEAENTHAPTGMDTRSEITRLVATPSEDKYTSLTRRGLEAILVKLDSRQGKKLLRKAIELQPDNPRAYHLLGIAYERSGLCSRAAMHFITAMELFETGTRFHEESMWAVSAACAFGSLHRVVTSSPMDPPAPGCHVVGLARFAVKFPDQDMPYLTAKPAWFTDEKQLLLTAERAVAAKPDNPNALHMRSLAYELRQEPSVDDLRQALRDRRLQLRMSGAPAGTPEHKTIRDYLERVETKLRSRIEADVEAKLRERTAALEI